MAELLILSKTDLEEVISERIKQDLQDAFKSFAPSSNESPLLTREEAAKILDISLPTLNQWEKDGIIPKPKRLGKRVYFHRKTFFDFLEDSS